MKFRNILFLFLALSFFACEEVPPIVTGTMVMDDDGPEPPTDLKDQKRQVIIEEFTGVRCVQCPAGSAEIETLLAANGIQLVAVSIHSSDFVAPHSTSQYDFNIQEGDDILQSVGTPAGYPSAVINRKKFEGQFDRQLGLAEWSGYINDEKVIEPKIKIGVGTAYDETSRELEIDLTFLVEETITEEARLSIMFTESDIVDPQAVLGAGLVEDYVHKHALRGMATPALGDVIDNPLIANSTFEISGEYTYTVPSDWVVENCKVVAFVHLANGDVLDVLQAVEVDMVE